MPKFSVVAPPASVSGASTITKTSPFQIAITAVSYQIQIIKIERVAFSNWGTATANLIPLDPYSVALYTGTTVSAGVGTLTPAPARPNSAAAATCRYGTGTTVFNGTTFTATSSPLTFTGGTNVVLRSEAIATNTEADYQFPFDRLIDVGSTLVVQGTSVNGSGAAGAFGTFGFTTLVVHYDQLHLARSS